MFSNLSIYHNKLIGTDIKEFPNNDFGVIIRVINPSGTIKSNLENIMPNHRCLIIQTKP